MAKSYFGLKSLALCALLFTASCSDAEWQVVYTKDVRPYGNERTAGSGVIYVRKVLMPEKTLSLKPVAEPEVIAKMAPAKSVSAPVEPVAPEEKVERFFQIKQSK